MLGPEQDLWPGHLLDILGPAFCIAFPPAALSIIKKFFDDRSVTNSREIVKFNAGQALQFKKIIFGLRFEKVFQSTNKWILGSKRIL